MSTYYNIDGEQDVATEWQTLLNFPTTIREKYFIFLSIPDWEKLYNLSKVTSSWEARAEITQVHTYSLYHHGTSACESLKHPISPTCNREIDDHSVKWPTGVAPAAQWLTNVTDSGKSFYDEQPQKWGFSHREFTDQ